MEIWQKKSTWTSRKVSHSLLLSRAPSLFVDFIYLSMVFNNPQDNGIESSPMLFWKKDSLNHKLITLYLLEEHTTLLLRYLSMSTILYLLDQTYSFCTISKMLYRQDSSLKLSAPSSSFSVLKLQEPTLLSFFLNASILFNYFKTRGIPTVNQPKHRWTLDNALMIKMETSLTTLHIIDKSLDASCT